MVDRFLKDFAEVASDWFWETDPEHRLVFLSERFTEVSGADFAQFLGRRRADVAGKSVEDPAWRVHLDDLRARRPFRNFVYRFARLDDDEPIWVKISGQPIFDAADGRFLGYRGVGSDVTREVAARAELRLTATMFDQVERMARVGGWRVELPCQTITWTPQVFAIYELDPAVTPTMAIAISAYPDGARQVVETVVAETLRTGKPYDITTEFVTLKGRKRWVRAIGGVDFEGGAPKRRFGTFQDVTEERENAALMERLAHQDAVTGLANRACFQLRLSAALAASAPDARATLALIDLDRFKEINDSLGHAAGDLVLQEIGARLKRLARPDAGDIVARIGGDEFAFLRRDDDDVDTLLREISGVFDAPLSFKNQRISVRGCVGGARFPDDGAEPGALMRSADLALYEAKNAGRGRAHRYAPTMSHRFERRIQLVRDLDGALRERALVPYYQPIVCLTKGRIRGFEALIRWRRPDGVLSAGAFQEAFDDRELGPRITACVLEHVFADMANWRDEGLAFGRVSFNVTEADLLADGFARDLERRLEAAGLAPSNLGVELTENILIGGDGDKARIEIDRLADMGVAISLDDFGTGFASLTHLTALPVSTLKIDRSFVNKAVDEASGGLAIVRAVTSLGADMGFFTIAEGVETQAHLDVLAGFGCELGQGFLYAPAVPAEAAPDLMRRAQYGWPRASNPLADRCSA